MCIHESSTHCDCNSIVYTRRAQPATRCLKPVVNRSIPDVLGPLYKNLNFL